MMSREVDFELSANATSMDKDKESSGIAGEQELASLALCIKSRKVRETAEGAEVPWVQTSQTLHIIPRITMARFVHFMHAA